MHTTVEKKRRTKRRGNGEGSIFQRADGRWAAVMNVGYDNRGRRVRRTVYGHTKAEVQDKLADLHGKKRTGTLTGATRMTLAVYLDRWLEDSIKLQKKPATYVVYRQLVENHINPRVGGISLSKLTAVNVQGMYADMTRAGCSARLVQMVHGVLHRALEAAVNPMRLIPFNPSARQRPRAPKPEVEFLAPEQAITLMKSTSGNRLHALYVMAITTGMRQGELFGLKWSDLNLDDGIVHVRRNLSRASGQFKVDEPKSAKGKRTITLSKIAVEALREHLAIMMREGFAGSEWVFVTRRGGHLTRSAIHGPFRVQLTRAKLPLVKFHALRHTNAVWMVADGVHAKVMQERLGHSHIGVTLDTYSHVLPSMQHDVADRIERRYRAAIG